MPAPTARVRDPEEDAALSQHQIQPAQGMYYTDRLFFDPQILTDNSLPLQMKRIL
jgi:hypothetical protein